MKKFILLGVSFILMISCLVVGSSTNAPLPAGPGSEADYKVENVEDLADVLKFLLDNGTSDTSSIDSETGIDHITLLSAGGEKYSVDLLSSKGSKKYNSATINILSTAKSQSSSTNPKYTGGVRSSSMSLDREMTMYITKDSTLYDSKGTANMAQTTEKTEYDNDLDYERVVTKQYSYTLDFDMQILKAKNTAYVNFKKFMYTDNTESRQLKYSNANQWIKMPYEIVDALVSVDSQNRDILKSFGDILDYLLESGEIDEDDLYITLDEYDFSRLYEETNDTPVSLAALEDGDLEFVYNLSSPATPYISYIMDYASEDSKEIKDFYGNVTDRIHVSSSASASEQFIIKNINNTVVSFDKDSVTVKVDNERQFDKLFMIEERKENDD